MKSAGKILPNFFAGKNEPNVFSSLTCHQPFTKLAQTLEKTSRYMSDQHRKALQRQRKREQRARDRAAGLTEVAVKLHKDDVEKLRDYADRLWAQRFGE